jgi:hypothetical protein
MERQPGAVRGEDGRGGHWIHVLSWEYSVFLEDPRQPGRPMLRLRARCIEINHALEAVYRVPDGGRNGLRFFNLPHAIIISSGTRGRTVLSMPRSES